MNRLQGTFGLLVVFGLVCFIPGCPSVTPECQTDADCDDGLFCNGEEFCLDGSCANSASLPCGEGEECDEEGDTCVGADPQGFQDANGVRGGTLYDKWWAVAGVDAPTDDHAFWATQDTNARGGADTWRCKECHGWDYKGVDGAYGSGSHMTGFPGIFGTALSAQEAFDTIKDDHGFGAAGLSDADIWDLAKFALEGPIDTDDILDGDMFSGSADAGEPLYASTCLACHGSDGLAVPPGADADFGDFVGLIANENPWELAHKVRFGQPGTAMPPQATVLTTEEVGDLGTYAQTLPQAP